MRYADKVVTYGHRGYALLVKSGYVVHSNREGRLTKNMTPITMLVARALRLPPERKPER